MKLIAEPNVRPNPRKAPIIAAATSCSCCSTILKDKKNIQLIKIINKLDDLNRIMINDE